MSKFSGRVQDTLAASAGRNFLPLRLPGGGSEGKVSSLLGYFFFFSQLSAAVSASEEPCHARRVSGGDMSFGCESKEAARAFLALGCGVVGDLPAARGERWLPSRASSSSKPLTGHSSSLCLLNFHAARFEPHFHTASCPEPLALAPRAARAERGPQLLHTHPLHSDDEGQA